jgi:hypothetical protein
VTLPASSAEGTVSTEPAFSRFMLSPTKASGLVRNSETSIWSRDTPEGAVRPAMRDSESPRATRTVSPPADAGAALAAGRAGCGAGAAAARVDGARGAAAMGAGTAAGAAGGGASGTVLPGAGVSTGAVSAGGVAAGRDCGGSNSIVYSRTRRPLAQVASTIRSTKGSSTARSVVTRSTWRPLRCTSCTLADGSAALYSTPEAR